MSFVRTRHSLALNPVTRLLGAMKPGATTRFATKPTTTPAGKTA